VKTWPIAAARDLDTARLDQYLTGVLGEPVQVVGLRALGPAAGDILGGLGDAGALQVDCRVGDGLRRFALSRTHSRAGGAEDDPPLHPDRVDVGFICADGNIVSAADAVGSFELVEQGDHPLYGLELDALLEGPAAALESARARALAGFLAGIHRAKRDEPALYARRARELLGVRVMDSLPHPWPTLPPPVCELLESTLVRWRWRLRERAYRLARTHGDFHPWNIVFREGTDVDVLHRRGAWGEPADDVAALGVSYLFSGMCRAAGHGRRGVAEPFRSLFHAFLSTYLERSQDHELFETLPPFLASRALALVHPGSSPDLPPLVGEQLVHLAICVAASRRFDPADVAWLCGVA
jgi:hypothetical protein